MKDSKICTCCGGLVHLDDEESRPLIKIEPIKMDNFLSISNELKLDSILREINK